MAKPTIPPPPAGFPRARMIAFAIAALVVGVVVSFGACSGKPAGVASTASSSGEAASNARTGFVDPSVAARGTVYGFAEDARHGVVSGATICARADDLPVCTTSDDAGRWTLGGLVAATYDLTASAANGFGVAGDEGTIHLAPGENHGPVTISLSPGAEVVGVVHDVNGAPIGGVTLVLEGRVATTIVKSLPDGSFSGRLPPGDGTVEVVSDGYYAEGTRFDAPGLPVDVVVTPESIVVGHVVDAESGMPIAGATVVVEDSATSGESRTDASGAFRVGRLAPGMQNVHAHAPSRFGVAAPIEVGFAQTSDEVVLQLSPAPSVVARVVIEGSQAPCLGGSVTLYGPRFDLSVDANVDADSVARFDAVPPGHYEAWATCDNGLSNVSKELDVDADIADLVITMKGGLAVRGVVTDEAGAVLPGARLGAYCDTATAYGNSGSDGRFTITPLSAGECTVTIEDVEMDGLKVNLVAGKDLDDVRLVRPTGGSLEGVVVDQKGAAVTNVTVRSDVVFALTDAAGHFLLHGLALADDAPKGFGVLRGATELPLDLMHSTMEAKPGGHVRLVVSIGHDTVQGDVVDVSGSPLPGATVQIFPNEMGGSALSARTDERGHFAVRDVLGPHVQLSVTFEEQYVSTDTDTTAPVRVVMPRRAQVAGFARLADGTAVHDLVVTVPAGASYRFPDGHFSIPLEPGEHRHLVFTAREGHAALDVAAPASDLVVSLQHFGVVKGVLYAFDTHRPIANAQVIVGDVWSRSDDDGRFEVRDSTDPNPLVSVRGEGSTIAAVTIDAPLGALTEVEILVGHPRASDGTPSGELGFSLAYEEGPSPTNGVRVGEVVAGRAAALAGIEPGALITAIDGVTIGSADVFYSMIEVPAGTAIMVTTNRGTVRLVAQASADPPPANDPVIAPSINDEGDVHVEN